MNVDVTYSYDTEGAVGKDNYLYLSHTFTKNFYTELSDECVEWCSKFLTHKVELVKITINKDYTAFNSRFDVIIKVLKFEDYSDLLLFRLRWIK